MRYLMEAFKMGYMWRHSSVVEHSTADREVPGSNPGVSWILVAPIYFIHLTIMHAIGRECEVIASTASQILYKWPPTCVRSVWNVPRPIHSRVFDKFPLLMRMDQVQTAQLSNDSSQFCMQFTLYRICTRLDKLSQAAAIFIPRFV